jgi:hypothetical protein
MLKGVSHIWAWLLAARNQPTDIKESDSSIEGSVFRIAGYRNIKVVSNSKRESVGY